MNSFILTTFIKAPVNRVFSMFADIDKAAEIITGIQRIERLTEGPVGVGTRFTETRIVLEKEQTEVFEFIEFKPDENYTVRAEFFGMEYISSITFCAQENGTQIELRLDTRPLSLKAKLAIPFNKLMAHAMEKMLSHDLEDLKSALELPARET